MSKIFYNLLFNHTPCADSVNETFLDAYVKNQEKEGSFKNYRLVEINLVSVQKRDFENRGPM